jgi:hypothetical protein
MDETFTTRLHALLAANPRICDNGCAVAVRQKVSPTHYTLVPKPEPSYQPSPEEVNRIYKLTTYIKHHLGDPPTTPYGRGLIGSYGWKHCLEKLPWKEGENTYVSNTEGMVAMMMLGYQPRWNNKDPLDPNCFFSVSRKKSHEIVREAYRRSNERRQTHSSQR